MTIKPIAIFCIAISATCSSLLEADTWLLDQSQNPDCAGGVSFLSLAVGLAERERKEDDRLFVIREGSVVPSEGGWDSLSPAEPENQTTGSLAPSEQLAWIRKQVSSTDEVHWLTAADNLVASKGMLEQLAQFAAIRKTLNIHLPDAPWTQPENDRTGIHFYGLDCGAASDTLDREVLDAVLEIAAERLGIPAAALGPDTSFLTLGADELTVYEINAEAADRFGVQGLMGELNLDTARNLSQAISEMKDLAGVVTDRSADEDDSVVEQTVFYATNRQPYPSAEDFAERFSGERSTSKSMAYGSAVVSIPSSHRKGVIESPFLGLKMFEDPKSHIILQSLHTLGQEDLYEEIAATLARSSGSDWDQHAVVFVHGFNVPFTEAVIRTAQVAFDIGFTGAPILFSWPSDGSLFGYMSDREDATWSVQYLKEFLNTTLARLEGKKVHLIAHSMGNQVLIGALQQMQLAGSGSDLFESAILAAPDFDAELFADQIAPSVRDLAKRWTIYTSDKDAALDISLEVNSNRRLGQPVSPIADFDVIDATGIEVSPWSVPEFHSYYATKQQVISDIRQALSGVDAASRGLKQRSRQGVVYYSMR